MTQSTSRPHVRRGTLGNLRKHILKGIGDGGHHSFITPFARHNRPVFVVVVVIIVMCDETILHSFLKHSRAATKLFTTKAFRGTCFVCRLHEWTNGLVYVETKVLKVFYILEKKQ